jgi:hypothetical protein
MAFYETPKGFAKTILSDLQGAWENMRNAIATHHPFPGSESLLFQVDEGMSWESVRDFQRMRNQITLISNMVRQNDVPEEVKDWLSELNETFDEVLRALNQGNIK